MGKVFKILTAGLLAGLVHSPANAALVSFTSDGTFTSITNCTGGSPGCSITNGGNVLKMSGASNQNQPSTLTITDITRTWAMMILGFAGVGFMAYRRKRGGNALTAA